MCVALVLLSSLTMGGGPPILMSPKQRAVFLEALDRQKQAYTAYKARDLAKAVSEMEKTVALLERVDGTTSSSVCWSLGFLARWQVERGQFEEAAKLFARASAAMGALRGRRHWRAVDLHWGAETARRLARM